jgi:transcription initiation factor TFIID subunit 6
MPPVLSCLLGKRLCEDPEKDDHWSLRDRCAIITHDLCRKFGNSYSTLIPRITKTMIKTLLDPQKPLSSHYGAIVGITSIGPHAVETLLIPHMTSYLEALSGGNMTDEEQPTPAEVSKCKMALKTAASKWINEAYSATIPEHEAKREQLRKTFNI